MGWLRASSTCFNVVSSGVSSSGRVNPEWAQSVQHPSEGGFEFSFFDTSHAKSLFSTGVVLGSGVDTSLSPVVLGCPRSCWFAQ